MVEVAFSDNIEQSNHKTWTVNGTLLFDPNRYWCLRSGSMRKAGDILSTTEKIRITQSDNAGDLVPLSRVWESDSDVVFSGTQPSGQKTGRCETTLSRPTNLPPDEEFTLSAFGLPEPVGVKWEKPIPTYVWILVAAGVCAVLALGFGYLWRCRRAWCWREVRCSGWYRCCSGFLPPSWPAGAATWG